MYKQIELFKTDSKKDCKKSINIYKAFQLRQNTVYDIVIVYFLHV